MCHLEFVFEFAVSSLSSHIQVRLKMILTDGIIRFRFVDRLKVISKFNFLQVGDSISDSFSDFEVLSRFQSSVIQSQIRLARRVSTIIYQVPCYSNVERRHCASPSGWLRDFIADYGVSLMVVAWTALSFSVLSKVPSRVPRRLFSPLP
ncbi:hypothetical protein ACSBR2_036564 [Camellia fascicularis]